MRNFLKSIYLLNPVSFIADRLSKSDSSPLDLDSASVPAASFIEKNDLNNDTKRVTGVKGSKKVGYQTQYSLPASLGTDGLKTTKREAKSLKQPRQTVSKNSKKYAFSF